MKFKLLLNSDYYEKQNGVWTDKSEDELYLAGKLANALEISVVGILRPAPESNIGSESGTVGYRPDLMRYLIEQVNRSEIVQEQKSNPDTDIFTGIPFEKDDTPLFTTMEELNAFLASLPEQEQLQAQAMISQLRDSGASDAQIVAMFADSMKQETKATYDGNLSLLGAADLNKPAAINIYPKDFEAKERIADIISEYNRDTSEEYNISYTDYIGLMMSSVTTIIDAISYILIAFVAISLIVSSIMIGIITYISVLERTKEIGILRSIGASKKDISRVFNAETLIVGFVSGALGILVTVLLNIPINMVIKHFTDIDHIASLPWIGAVVLVAISMLLTFIAGLIPSRVAAKKDPVVALRTE